MRAFIDFEASSLAERSHPIEVGWVFEDGRSESHLIKPLESWTDWSAESEAIHGIDRATLLRDGAEVTFVAGRMIDVLSGHDLLASAPSWDGKWLSTLLRGAGLPRHALRLRKIEETWRETASLILTPAAAPDALDREIDEIIATFEVEELERTPKHRALADAQDEYGRWLRLCTLARHRTIELTREGA